MCLGNSFAHLFDVKGDMSDIKLAIKNFHEMLKPGGYLIIDHRNYDYTLKHGKTPAHSIYYNVSILFFILNARRRFCEYAFSCRKSLIYLLNSVFESYKAIR